ncbi:MAG: MBL fold metallo-hydrolase [Bacteroidales bacterium]|jgi:phosphoribosyl 1,2-cyclic phosphate phosphodiesterase|nr:MBL fold metallo-hydrolase [Bacteroidales bacterium]
MKIIFLGTGTSHGVPVIACSCAVCQSKDTHDKRLRSSIFISHKGQQFVIDAGPDFRQQMLQENIKHLDFILLTHEHRDHIAGLDDVRAFNYVQNKAMDIYADKFTCNAITRAFYYAFNRNRYPGIPALNLHDVGDLPFTINDITIIPVKVMHCRLPILGFRIENMAYITDASYIEAKELNKLKNLDVLIINALQIGKHYSHFNLEEAVLVAEYLQAKQTYFTHISHYISYEKYNKCLPQNISLAYDRLTIEI